MGTDIIRREKSVLVVTRALSLPLVDDAVGRYRGGHPLREPQQQGARD